MSLRVLAVIWREEDMYVAREIVTSVTSQGRTIEDALNNLREALELYLEEAPDAIEKLSTLEDSIIGVIEVTAKAPKAFRT